MISAKDVHVVVVAFDPGPTLESLCRVLVAAGCHVLVVDNASQAGQGVLTRCQELGAQVLRAHDNVGVSGALTIGLQQAHSSEWLLTFDQDSVIDDTFLRAMFASTATQGARTAMIGPHVVDAASGDLLQGREGSATAFDVPLVITSGALCRVSALHDVGGFGEDLFIDHVDHDICLRLRGAGWRIVIEPAAVMRHSIGRMRTHRVAGVGVRNSHHGPDRQYYKYRNFLLLVRRGTARLDLRWALHTLLALTWAPLKIVAFEEDRRSKLRAIADGIHDGLLGRGGRRP